MKRILIFCILFLHLIALDNQLFGQVGAEDCLTAFTRRIGNENSNEEPFCMLPYQSGTFLIGGREGSHSILLLTDPAGNILFQRAFDFTSGQDFIANMTLDSDGFLVGSARDQLNSEAVNILFKYDIQNNSFLWTRRFAPFAFSRLDGVYESPANGNYCFHGGVETVINDYLMEIDRNTGELNWGFQWDFGGNADVLIDNYVTTDAVYFAGEGRLGAGLDELRPTLMKFDHFGNLLWSRIHLRWVTDAARLYNMSLFIENDTIVNLARGSLINDDLTNSKMFLYKTDIEGHLLWAKSYSILGGTTVAGIQLHPISGGYIAQGTYNEGGSDKRMFIAYLNKEGGVEWAKQVNTTSETPGLVKPLSVVADSFIVFASQTTQYDMNGNYDILFGKISLNPTLTPNTCDLIENIDLIAEPLGWPYNNDYSYMPLKIWEGHGNTAANVNVSGISLPFSDIPGCNCGEVIQDSCDIQLDLQTEIACPFQLDGSVTVVPVGGVPPYTYNWENDTVSTNTLTNLNVGTYYVTVTDVTGCSAVDSVMLEAAMRPKIGIETQDASCFGVNDGMLTISTDDPDLQFLVAGHPLSSQTVFESLWPGGDQFFVVDTFGCQWVNFYFIEAPEKLVLDLPPSLEIESCDSVKIEWTGFQESWQFEWSPSELVSCADCPDPFVLPLSDTTLVLTVTDTNGCKANDQIRLLANYQVQAALPNAFSPNGDSKNDVFFVLGKCAEKVLLLRVFDRWGNLVFEKSNTPPNDPLYGWDGKVNGKDAPSDVYVYQAKILLPDGREIERKGDLTLLR